MRRQAQSAPTIALALCLAHGCSPEASPGEADVTQNQEPPVDAGPDLALFQRIRRAAARICREICDCRSIHPGDSPLTYCHVIPESCCSNRLSFVEETGDCELTFIHHLEFAASACEMAPDGNCSCEAFAHCLDWLERTECPRDRAPLPNGLVVPRTCVDTNPGWSDRCCTWGETTCELLESTLAAERAGAFTPQ
jgi:hypothetical protein